MKIRVATDFVHSVGQKLQQGLELAVTAKGIYDVGKTIYSAGRLAAPLLLAAL